MACLNPDPMYQDFSATNALTLSDFMTPQFQFSYPIMTTPLMLPRDWTDTCFSPSAGALCDAFDFQSNHLENAHLDSGPTSPVSGLGIRNVDLLEAPETTGSDSFGLSDIPVPDCLAHNTIGSVFNPFGHITDISNDSSAGLGSSWSFSSILRSTELAKDQDDVRIQSSLSSKASLGESTSQPSADSDTDASWSFEKLSAASGLSIAELAAQISATAEATLKRMSGDHVEEHGDLSRIFKDGEWADDFNSRGHNSVSAEKTSGLVASTQESSQFEIAPWSDICVNPSDILPVSATPSLSVTPGNIFLIHPDDIPKLPGEILPDNQGLQVDTNLEADAPKLASPYQGSFNPPPKRELVDSSLISDDDVSVFESPSSSEYSPVLLPFNGKRATSSRLNSRATRGSGKGATSGSPRESISQNLLPINLGTPVFDAHRGIDIEELKAKAERYRLRNQGRDYDKRWLISFAGKLSARGELMDEFRCYVAGCKQSNKRRDHILIHVGAHLDQRPFKCMHW